MSRLESYLLALISLCLSVTNVAPESISNSTSTVSTAGSEVSLPPTPPPGGAASADPTSVATTEAVSGSSPGVTILPETETTGAFTETQPGPAAQPVVPAEGNLFKLSINISFLSLSPGYCSVAHLYFWYNNHNIHWKHYCKFYIRELIVTCVICPWYWYKDW